MRRRRLSGLRLPFLSFALLSGVLVATPASPQNCGLLCAIINAAIVSNAVKKWNAVDPDVRQCLVNNYGLYGNNLAQQGITPDDYRVQSQMQYCQQQVDQARYQAEQRQRALEEQQAALKRKIEAAQAAWDALDSQLRQCMIDKGGVVPGQMAQQGIAPDDYQVQTQMQSCRDAIAQAAQAKAHAEARHKDLVARFPSDWVDAIESGKVIVGMTKGAVLEARGQPESKQVIPPDDELWVYGSDRIAISKGKVTYIGH